MRKTTGLISALVGAGLLLSGASGFAAEPAPSAATKRVCRTVDAAVPNNVRCTPAKAVPAAQPRLQQISKASLDRSTCNRQPTKVERDTCLNRVESTA